MAGSWQRLPQGSMPVDPVASAKLDGIYRDLEHKARFICWFTKYYHSDKAATVISQFLAQLEALDKEAAKWSSSK